MMSRLQKRRKHEHCHYTSPECIVMLLLHCYSVTLSFQVKYAIAEMDFDGPAC